MLPLPTEISLNRTGNSDAIRYTCASHLIDRVAFMRLRSIRIDSDVHLQDHGRNFSDISADDYLRGTTEKGEKLMSVSSEKADASATLSTDLDKASIKSVLSWIRRDFQRWVLVVPILSSTVVYQLSAHDVNGWGDTARFKNLMEVVHPAFVAVFMVVSWMTWGLTREAPFAFFGILGLFVFTRELMGQGYSFIVYFGIIGLMIYAVRNRESLRTLFPSKWAATFLFMCFVCYASSQLIDRGAIKRIGWLIMWDTDWVIPFSSNFEEALESLGGFFLLLTPFVTARNRARK